MRTVRGFTLIELLVVIAMIGILVGVVLVSLSGATDAARLARVRSFSSQLAHLMGIDAVLVWKFEETSGNTVRDISGYGNDGSGSTLTRVNGSLGQGMDMLASGNISVTNANLGPGTTNIRTVAYWFNSTIAISNTVVSTSEFTSSNGAAHQINTGVLNNGQVVCKTNDGTIDSLSSPTGKDFLDGKWHFVVCVIDTNEKRVYVDDALENSRTVSLNMNKQISVWVATGAGGGIGGAYNGLVDEVALYTEGFSITEVRKLYAEGLKKYYPEEETHNRALSATQIHQVYTASASRHGIALTPF